MRIEVLGLAAAMVAGCSMEEVNAGAPKQATAWRATSESALRSGAVGSDCTDLGERACLTGVCIHARPEHDQGYFCSARCQDDDNCPSGAGWRCRELLPGRADFKACIPPANWAAREVVVTSAFQPAAAARVIVDNPPVFLDGGAR